MTLAALEERAFGPWAWTSPTAPWRCSIANAGPDPDRGRPDPPAPAASEPFAAVLALDVIEHLDDDRAAVARLGELATPGAVVV